MNESELYKRLIAKHPAYAKIPQEVLMPKIYEKYPQYRSASEEKNPFMEALGAGIPPVTLARNMKTIQKHGPDIYQFGGNVMGAGVGALTGNPVAGAAMGGSLARGVGQVMTDIGQGKPVSESFNHGIKEGTAGELFGMGLGKIAEAGPGMVRGAKRIVQSIVKPGSAELEKNPQMMETILKSGLAKGTKYKMYDRTMKKLQEAGRKVDSIIRSAGMEGKTGTAGDVIENMNALAKQYRDNVDEASAQAVETLRDQYIQKQGIEKPVFGDVEKGQFVMGPASKQVTSRFGSQERPDSVLESVRENITGGNEPIGQRIVTQKTSAETPEDIVGMNVPRRGIKYISPETRFSIRPETFGVSRPVTEQIGTELNEIPVGDMQANKEGVYRLLEGKRSGGGYGAETKSTEIAGRQAAARGYRSSIENVVPEVGPINKSASELIPVTEALSHRLNVSGNRNLEGLGDMIYDVPAVMNLDSALPALAVGRRVLGTDAAKNALASGMYRFGKSNGLDALKIGIRNRFGRAATSSLFGGGASDYDSQYS